MIDAVAAVSDLGRVSCSYKGAPAPREEHRHIQGDFDPTLNVTLLACPKAEMLFGILLERWKWRAPAWQGLATTHFRYLPPTFLIRPLAI